MVNYYNCPDRARNALLKQAHGLWRHLMILLAACLFISNPGVSQTTTLGYYVPCSPPICAAPTHPTCENPYGSVTVINPPAGSGYYYSIDGGPFQASAYFGKLEPGYHYIRVRKGYDGCISYPTKVYINPRPYIPAAPTCVVTTHPTCDKPYGSVTVTNPPAGSGYYYSIDNGPFQASPYFGYLQPGYHYIRVRKGYHGCPSYPTKVYIYPVPSKPYVHVTAGPSYCHYNVPTVRITATASGGSGTGYTYVFTRPDGSTFADADGVIEVTQPGTYRVVVTDSRGCKAYGSVTPYFVPCKPYAGCSPGYWKNHHSSWCDKYDPSSSFFGVFNTYGNTGGLSSSLTLDGALNTGGGGYAALARQATAALLNACNYGVNYPYTEYQIKTAVISAFRYGTATLGGKYYGSVEALKNELDRANNLGCPLNGPNNATSTNIESSIAEEGIHKGLNTAIDISAYPNPYTESASINFTVQSGGEYTLFVHDLNGRVVQELGTGIAEAGKSYGFILDTDLPAGLYIARLKIGNETKAIRIMRRK
ncbi:T9SS type A sorting domain-containing protein [Rufibacter latericius]|uniref:T9SS C-terminal target domain-containing protein n=1 Tax=Rufibacter latericius TaxID=2487040 RepID=A0A3M9N0S6_9BACT|nr:T9SS type A sorting domain-containing protein [Rufibacter latericius]RNI30733.1 T9SS C-terminal target domain-containing protein [Rufibacter latericius]